MKVRLSAEARAKQRTILARLLDDNPFAARRFRDEVGRSLQRLGHFPYLGHYVPEFPDLPLRQVIVGPYRFFYVVEEVPATVWIVDIWHGAQLPKAPAVAIR